MKLLSLVILLSSIIFTFNYVWINRLEIKNKGNNFSLIINKWTGHHCYIQPDLDQQESNVADLDVIACVISKKGKILFP